MMSPLNKIYFYLKNHQINLVLYNLFISTKKEASKIYMFFFYIKKIYSTRYNVRQPIKNNFDQTKTCIYVKKQQSIVGRTQTLNP